MVAWGVGKGRVSCCSDLESWGDIDPIDNFITSMVGWWRFLLAVAGTDGRDEAQLTEASV